MSERRAVFVLWSTCAILAALGVAASWLDLFANVFLLGVVLLAAMILAVTLGEVAIYRTARKEEESGAEEEMRRTFANYVRGPSLVILDLVIVCLAYLAAYLVKFDGRIPAFSRQRLFESLPVVIITQAVFFHAFGLYRGIWRYFGVRDLLAILKAVVAGVVASGIAVVLLHRFSGYSRAVFVIDGMALFLLLSGSRFLFRALVETRRFPAGGHRVLVIGAGDRGELGLRALRTREGGGFLPVGILAKDPRLAGRKLLGIRILGSLADLEATLESTTPEEIVLSEPLTEEELALVRTAADRHDIPLYLAPGGHDFVRI